MCRDVTLREVTRSNVCSICELAVGAEQRHLVSSTAHTVAESHYEPGAILRAIYLDEAPVGLLLVETDRGTPYLVRFLVAHGHQGVGIGRAAVGLLTEELARLGHDALETSFLAQPEGSSSFWVRCGFEDTGDRRGDEPVFIRRLR